MKKIYITFTALLLTMATFAQIPNGSFEQWQGTHPTSWFMANNDSAVGILPATETTIAHQGAKALKLAVVNVGGTIYGGRADCELFSQTTKPIAFHYWARTNLVSGDYFYANASINNSATVGFGYASKIVTTNSTIYKEYISVFNYSGSSSAAFCSLVLNLLGPAGGNPSIGSEVYVDDLFWGDTNSTAGIEDQINNQFAFESLTPNPSNQASALIYNLKEAGLTNIALFDIYGKKIKNVVTEQQSPGHYKAYIETNDLAAGVYLCQLNVNGVTVSKKLVVTGE